MTIEDYERFIKDKYGIPYVSYENLDISVAKDITEALINVFNKYPRLADSICAFGTIKDINDKYNLTKNSIKSKKIKWEDYDEDIEDILLATVNVSSKKSHKEKKNIFLPCLFIGIGYGEEVMLENIGTLNNIAYGDSIDNMLPRDCTTFKAYIYHEIGHVLDYVLELRNDQDLYDIVKDKTNNFDKDIISEKVSGYYEKEPYYDEIIADSFSAYMINPYSNDLISSIGIYIDNKYNRFENSRIFRVNDRYRIKNRKR